MPKLRYAHVAILEIHIGKNDEPAMVSNSSRNDLPIHDRQIVINEIHLNEMRPAPESLTTNWQATCARKPSR